MVTTFRTGVRTALAGLLQTYATANPTLLRHVYKRRPPGFPETPCVYLGSLAETMTHDSGVRTRTLTPSIYLVDVLSDADEVTVRQDTLVDVIIDLLTANPHAVSGTTLVEPTGTTDLEDESDGAFYSVVRIDLARVVIAEGRN